MPEPAPERTPPDDTTETAVACPHCPDGHNDPRRRLWGVWVGPALFGERPYTLHVGPSDGAHVAESDAEWLHELIRTHRSDAAPPDDATEDAEYRLEALRVELDALRIAIEEVRKVRDQFRRLAAAADTDVRDFPARSGNGLYADTYNHAATLLSLALNADAALDTKWRKS